MYCMSMVAACSAGYDPHYMQDIINGYRCSCAAGYTGTNCGINIDDCTSSPCVNGNCTVS